MYVMTSDSHVRSHILGVSMLLLLHLASFVFEYLKLNLTELWAWGDAG